MHAVDRGDEKEDESDNRKGGHWFRFTLYPSTFSHQKDGLLYFTAVR